MERNASSSIIKAPKNATKTVEYHWLETGSQMTGNPAPHGLFLFTPTDAPFGLSTLDSGKGYVCLNTSHWIWNALHGNDQQEFWLL